MFEYHYKYVALMVCATVEETENPSVRVGGGGCGLIVFCSWMIPCFYYDPLC